MKVSFYSVILCRKLPGFEDICTDGMDDESIGLWANDFSESQDDELEEFKDDFVNFGGKSKSCSKGFCIKDE